jgi:hypothetical protein
LIVGGSLGAIICLIIVFGGVVWHFLVPIHSTVPAQSSATPAATPVYEPPKPSKPMLTAYDVEQRLRAVDTIIDYLDQPLMEVSAQSEKLGKSIYNLIEKGTAIQELDKFTEATRAAVDGYYVLVARYDGRFQDIVDVAVSSTNYTPQELPNKASLLRAEIQEMAQRGQFTMPQQSLSDLFKSNKLMYDFHDATNGKFWIWINEKRTALATRRREYQNAEVYPATR